MKTPFLGAFSVSRSKDLSDCQIINLFPEFIDNKSAGKDVGALYMTPGLDLKATIGSGPIRGLKPLTLGGITKLYALSGNTLYSLDTSFTSALIGTAGQNTQGPVSMTAVPNQLAYFDGINGYSYDGTTFAAIMLPFPNPGVACEQDGFVLVNQKMSNLIWQSNLNDLTTWNALNFSSEEARPGNVVAMADLKRQVYMYSDNYLGIWVNQGLPGFAFQRIEGSFIEQGTGAPAAVARGGETLFWLSKNEEGQNVAIATGGVTPERISTHALEYRWSTYATTSDAIGYCYQQEGHLFYVITFPTGNETWAFDATYGLKADGAKWHQRAKFANGNFLRHQGNAYAFFNGFHIIGDNASGAIYAMNLNTLTDAGAQRKWLRTWRALEKPVFEPTRFDNLDINCTTGISVNPNDNPLMVLRYANDGGYNWSAEQYSDGLKTGQTGSRIRFTRLGSTRRDQGLDRIYELSSTDQFQVALMGAEQNVQ